MLDRSKLIAVAIPLVALAAGGAAACGTGVKDQASSYEQTAQADGAGGWLHTLYLDAPAGQPLRLVHVPGVGWKYAAGWKSTAPTDDSMRLKTAVSSLTTALSTDAPVPVEEPLTVFIDGPTGYTYAWIHDQGWKFVGRLTDRNP